MKISRSTASLLVLTLLVTTQGMAQSSSPAVTAQDLEAHVRYLASDELEGRGSGLEGNRKAAAYIAGEFKKYGLLPAGDNGTYYQSFEFVSSAIMGKQNKIVFSGESLGENGLALTLDSDFRPFGFTSNDTVDGFVAFVGYGISAPDKGYDDYQDIDVTGKVVIALRYSPEGNDPHGELFSHSAFRSKARAAREHGAVGLLVVAGPADEPEDDLVRLSFDQSIAASGIVAMSMRRSVLDKLFPLVGRNLAAIQDSIRVRKVPLSFSLPAIRAHIVAEVELAKATTANIIGYLPGTDTHLKDEALVIGAHMDHLGYGGPGSGSLQPDTVAIHNGADDNASGSGGLLELAQLFASEADNARSLVFIAFSGEELGTLGSGYYVKNPFIPLEKTVTMLNMDMIGRMENNVLSVHGMGTAVEWLGLVDGHKDSILSIKTIDDGFGPSDHSQFYGKDIPVLFFFTGTHTDYHKPSDDTDKINYTGEERIVRFISSIANDIAKRESRPTYVRVQSSSSNPTGGDTRGFTVTLGVIPDYSATVEGMAIGGVRPNGPAAKADMRTGDVIVGMNGKKILNIYDYMAVLGELHSGDKVAVDVLRAGVPLSLAVQVEKRK